MRYGGTPPTIDPHQPLGGRPMAPKPADIPQRQNPLWRSLLFVPVNVERFVAKAPTVGAC